jgi:large subunit ribosomal protein L25
METKSLTVALRDGQGKGAARRLRGTGKIPGVVYGAGQPARSVALDHRTFDLLVRSGSHHGLLDLSFESGEAPIKALVREIQVHPVSRDYVHVDLQRVSMTEKIRVDVPIVLLGKPEGVRTQGGILEHNLRHIEVECLPGDIPAQIELDVSALSIGQSLHVSDLKVTGVVLLAHAETTVATVSVPAAERAHEEAAAAVTEGAAAAAEGAEPKPEAEKPSEKPEKPEKEAAKPGKEKPAKGGKS